MNASSSWLRRHRLPLLGVMAALFLCGLMLWNLRGHGPDPRLEAIRQKGYPVTLAELDAWYPQVPEAQNVALVYAKVFALPLFTNDPSPFASFSGNNWLPLRGQLLAPDDKAELTALLSTNEALLRPLYATAGPCRYPVDLKQGFNAQLPHLSRCKSAVITLTAAAILHAENGERERALQDFAAATHVVDSFSEEPILVSQLVRIACWSLLLKRVETAVNLTAFDAEQLARLQKLVESAERPQSLARAMAGERAGGLSIFDDPAHWLSVAWQNGTPPTTRQRLATTALVDGLKASGFFRKDRAFYLDVMATNVAAAELPLPEQLQAGQSASSLIRPHRFYVFSSMLLPALVKPFNREAEMCARQRTAQVALAIERFRLAHTNALPKTLDELVPAFLNCEPADPFDGKPLRYKRLQPGYVVYSIGPDGKDDGGLEPSLNSPNAPHDVTFILAK